MAEVIRECLPDSALRHFEITFSEPIVISGNPNSIDRSILDELRASISYMRDTTRGAAGKCTDDTLQDNVENIGRGGRDICITGLEVQRYGKHIGISVVINGEIREELWQLTFMTDKTMYPLRRGGLGGNNL